MRTAGWGEPEPRSVAVVLQDGGAAETKVSVLLPEEDTDSARIPDSFRGLHADTTEAAVVAALAGDTRRSGGDTVQPAETVMIAKAPL